MLLFDLLEILRVVAENFWGWLLEGVFVWHILGGGGSLFRNVKKVVGGGTWILQGDLRCKFLGPEGRFGPKILMFKGVFGCKSKIVEIGGKGAPLRKIVKLESVGSGGV